MTRFLILPLLTALFLLALPLALVFILIGTAQILAVDISNFVNRVRYS